MLMIYNKRTALFHHDNLLISFDEKVIHKEFLHTHTSELLDWNELEVFYRTHYEQLKTLIHLEGKEGKRILQIHDYSGHDVVKDVKEEYVSPLVLCMTVREDFTPSVMPINDILNYPNGYIAAEYLKQIGAQID